MYFLLSLIPATVAVVLGYFIYFSSTKADGAAQLLGRILAIWIFVLAAAVPTAGAYATYADVPSLCQVMRSTHS